MRSSQATLRGQGGEAGVRTRPGLSHGGRRTPPSKNQKMTFAASWTMRGPAEVVGVPNAESLLRVVPLTE